MSDPVAAVSDVPRSRFGFPTGARPSPRYRLLRAIPFQPVRAPLPQFAVVPPQLDAWGNDQYGDCVSAEEAFALAAFSVMLQQPELFVPASVVIDWARNNGYLNGADLAEVMDSMARSGFPQGGKVYDDGPHIGVDYSNEALLQAAIDLSPVKIAIDSSALPQGAGNHMGWSAFGGRPGEYGNTDHCVSVSGHGPLPWLAEQLGVSVPSGAPPTGYHLYTWKTIGLVDHAWLMSTCVEAWSRNPEDVTLPPGPTPTPTPTPPPPPPPVPGGNVLTLTSTLGPGSYPLGGITVPTDVAACLAALRSQTLPIPWPNFIAQLIAWLATLRSRP